MPPYAVVLTDEALADLVRLQAFAIERELSSHTPDLDVVARQRDAIDRALRVLAFAPETCRRPWRASRPSQRELVIPFGRSGLVATFDIRGDTVWIGAIRHQLELADHRPDKR